MTGKTHMAVGAAAALAVAPLVAVPAIFSVPAFVVPPIQTILGATLGALLPDTDLRYSEGSNELRRAWAALVVLAAVLLAVDQLLVGDLLSLAITHLDIRLLAGILGLMVVCAAGRASGHRGFSHSLLALVLATLCMGAACRPLAFPFAVGYASHLLLDLFNNKAVRLFWPAGGISLGICSSGGIVDRLLFLFSLLGSLVMVWQTLVPLLA